MAINLKKKVAKELQGIITIEVLMFSQLVYAHIEKVKGNILE